MGAVYEVEDTSVGRVYALKTLHPEMVDRQDLAVRMREEARALGRLEHSKVVQIVTAGVSADGTPFYVMERLVGQNLRRVIDSRGALGKAHAYRIGIDILEALEHAHERGMIHRDVKPENIFLHRGKDVTETKLLDFGIVRMLSKHASLTRGKFIGTLKYASPEQVTGRPLGPATDVYSAALVVYEMLAGRGPFDDAGDGYAIGAAHAGSAPPSLAAIVPAEVDAILQQALAKAPEARPPCAAIAAELRRALRSEEQTPDAKTEIDLLTAKYPLGAEAPASTEQAEIATVTGPGTGMAPSITGPVQGRHATTRLDGGVVISATLAAPVIQANTAALVGAQAPVAAAAAGIDRNAPTRIPAPATPAVRAPANDTRIDAPDALPSVIVHSTPAPQPPPAFLLAVRPEAPTVSTKPHRHDRTAFAAVAVAATLAVVMIVGAVAFVRRAHGAGGGVTVDASATH